jgi:hypothetical protein
MKKNTLTGSIQMNVKERAQIYLRLLMSSAFAFMCIISIYN